MQYFLVPVTALEVGQVMLVHEVGSLRLRLRHGFAEGCAVTLLEFGQGAEIVHPFGKPRPNDTERAIGLLHNTSNATSQGILDLPKRTLTLLLFPLPFGRFHLSEYRVARHFVSPVCFSVSQVECTSKNILLQQKIHSAFVFSFFRAFVFPY
jgi:hypothetical protein